MNKLFWFRVCIVFVVAVLNACANESENHWPSIHPLTYKVHVTSDNPKVSINIFSEINPSEKLYALRCNKNDGVDDEDDGLNFIEIQKSVENLYKIDVDGKYKSHFDVLMKNPVVASCYIIQGLKPVDRTTIGPDDSRPTEIMNTIWGIRALRYMTNNKEFTALTKYNFGDDEVDHQRKFSLYVNEDEGDYRLHPFRELETTGRLYFAPVDAQAAIIEQWKEWYINESKTFKFKQSESLVDWYVNR